MSILVYSESAEDEDLEVDCVVYYDFTQAWWIAEFDEEKIRYVAAHDDVWNQKEFLCFQCRQDLEPYFREHGRNSETACPNCSLSISNAILAP